MCDGVRETICTKLEGGLKLRPLLSFEKRALVTFIWAFWKMRGILGKDSDDFGQIYGHLPTLCPLLKPRFGQ